MDEAEQDQSEARLKELFDSFDVTGTGSLGHEELAELCHVLQLETVAPGALQQTLLQGDLLSRVHFDQFKEALILILSRTLTNEESFQEPDSSPEAQPKYIKGGKRYGRRSLPEFQKSVEDFAEVTVIEPLNEEAQPSCISNNDCEEHWRSQDSEEYEAEGQLRFWNPDDPNASPNISPTQDWIEEKLHEVCESLGISRDGHLSRKKLVSICKQYGLQNVDMQVAEDVFRNLEHDGTMSIEDFFYGFFKIGKPLPPSASTPYRQLKRHLSMQSFDECGRRTTTPSAMTSTIGFRVFSNLDDGMGYAEVEQILDAWQEEGIENSHEILKALDFNLDGRINLTELTLALENELLISKNGIYQAVLASFKTEIRHLMEQADQEAREKEKLRLDLEKAEKWKLFMTSEVDERHSAIERQNEYNLSKLEDEYKERVAALKSELQREREQIQQQASKQQADLEQEMAKLRTEENDLRDCLALTLKENSRLENELQETGEKLLKCQGTISKLQKNWENVLAEKYGDLDPGSAEFFLQEERLMQMKNTYERQCRELQDQIDELQSQLEEYQGQGRVVRLPLNASLYEELDDSSQAPDSEDCNPLNMSIEAEMAIEQLKDQHQQDLCSLQEELQNRLCHYQKQLEESKTRCGQEQEILQQHHAQERQALEEQVDRLQAQVSELQEELGRLRQEWQEADSQQKAETGSLQASLEEKASLVDQLKFQHQEELQARLQEAREGFGREREELVHARVRLEEKMRAMVQVVQEEKAEMEGGFHEQLQRLEEKQVLEKEALQQELAGKYREELQEERAKMENEFNGRVSRMEEQFAVDRQALVSKYGEALKGLEERYQRELREASEEKSQWEFEKDETAQEDAEAQERWKEMLAKEKEALSALTEEKHLLEKRFEECVSSLVLEKEQLQKQLEDVTERERELHRGLQRRQEVHEQELQKRGDEGEMSGVEEDQQLLLRKLRRLEAEFKQEKSKLTSRLATVEHLEQEALSRAAEEEEELTLEGNIDELQQELQCLSKLQRNLAFLNREADTQRGDFPGPAKPQEPRELMDFLADQKKDQDPSAEGGAAAAVSTEGKLLRSPGRSPSFIALVPESLGDSRLLNVRDQEDAQVKTDGGIGESGSLAMEIEETILEGPMETTLVLEKAYEEIWVENDTLKRQQRQLRERISLLEAECDQATLDRQDMASQVEKELDEILKTIPQPNALPCGSEECKESLCRGQASVAKLHPDCVRGSKRPSAGAPEAELHAVDMADHRGAIGSEKGELENQAPELWGAAAERDASSRAENKGFPVPEELELQNQTLKAEVGKLLEQNARLEDHLPQLLHLQSRLEESDRESLALTQEKVQLQERVMELEEAHGQVSAENAELLSTNLVLQSRLGKMEAFMATLKTTPKSGRRHGWGENGARDAETEARGLLELNRKLKEKVAALLKQKGTHAQEREDLNAALWGLKSACGEQRRELDLMRCEMDRLREENAVLRNEIAFMNEEGSICDLRLRELNGSREELWQQVESVQKEKVAAQKLAKNLKKQASELKARNQQLEFENAELDRKTSPHQVDAQDLNQRLRKVLRQKEAGKGVPEEREGSWLREELENCKLQTLEMELSQLRAQALALEQENYFLKEELEKGKQIPRCPDLSDLQNEISGVIVKNEKLLKENEALSEELNRCAQKVAKVAFLEDLVASLKQEKSSLERQNQTLKTQKAASQDKMQNFDDAVQNTQVSRLKSDLRVSQQEKEALKQEVMSLHQQLQTSSDKNRALEAAVHSAGLQSQQKQLCWDELGLLAKQDQQLLRQDNERLQQELQSAKSDLAHSREKIRQLESAILTQKHLKHQSHSGIVNAIEQEKLSLKRECERLQKELASANRKISQMNSLEHELEAINLENEGLRKKQVKRDEQQLLHSSSSVMLSPSQHPRDLQQQGCPMVPREEHQQLQRQLLQEERRCQRLQEELENRPLETNMAQGGQKHLLKTMEKRMMDVEQQLRLVKRLLQDKVNQLKEQLAKNTKADEMVKDLFVENAQLLKALEMTEQRQKTVEKKNYLLEEKIANLGRIVKNLTSPTLGSAAQLGS
ncbi:ninein isoform X3 [Zootoca vivipara]|uniref:ninein isoform X3 n=1 Tax=Zootoca vivipara TaxID=8524 RepID=UPI00293BADA1|nr:ninein isoform X3 [Zootoca vivipara]